MISSLSELKRFLREHQIHPKKRLSQNFLIDTNIVKKVIDSAGVAEGERVLEIGAGAGAITEILLERGAKVVAVEKDPILAPLLKRFEDLEVFEGDILDYPIESFGQSKIVANLPYHLTSPILGLILPRREIFSSATLIVQEEVARRLTAQPRDSDYGSLTVFTQFYSTPRYLFPIKRQAFYPAPKIDSAVVSLTLKEPPEVSSEEVFFMLVRTAFQQRRKMLRNSLSKLYPGCTLTKRPEELSVQEFVDLYKKTLDVLRGEERE